MQRKLNSLIGLISFSSITFSCLNVHAAEKITISDYYSNSYIGIAGHRAHYRFDHQFGAPLFNRSVSSVGLIIGLPFNPHFGLEFEYNVGQTSYKNRTAGVGDYLPDGVHPIAPEDGYEIYQTCIRVDSLNLSITGALPLKSLNASNISLYGSLGGSLLKIKANYRLIGSFAGLRGGQNYIRCYKRPLGKLVPVIQYGLQTKIDNNLSLRIFGTWKRFAHVKVAARGRLNFHSTRGYGFSIIYSF